MNTNITLITTTAIMLAVGSANAAISYFDGVFAPSNWNEILITNASGSGSSTAVGQLLTGGNPNEFRSISITLVASAPGGAALSMNINNNAFYDPNTQGMITTIDYSEDSINFSPDAGNVQSTGLLIVQNGNIFVQRNPVLVMPSPTFSNWNLNSAPGLTAADLWEVTPTGLLDPNSNPDFSAAGGIMQLGFYRGASSGNFVGTGIREAGIDNWSVRIVPAPAGSLLLGAGGLVLARRRRS